MPPTFEHCFTINLHLSKDHSSYIKTVKGGPQRTVVPITHGSIEGSGTKAEILPGSADFLLLNPETNTGHLEVRMNARTADGHGIYIRYDGILKIDEKSALPLQFSPDAKSTQFGDQEWFITPIIETSDPNLKWVESSVFFGEGRWNIGSDTGIEYYIYRLRPSA